MARVNRSGGVGKRSPRPSANEALRQMTNALGWESIPVSASRGEFNKLQDIMQDDVEIFRQYGPTKYENLAGLPAEEYEEYYDKGGKIFSRQFYEVVSLEDEDIDYIPGMQGPQNEEDSSPADLTLVPTSTTNPERPRTVAAGYDEDDEKLTVMFRDGTLYNYYEVTRGEWQSFKATKSKGAYIYRVLDFKPRGYADDSNLGRKERDTLYRFARGFQIHKGGKLASQNKATYKTKAKTKKR